MTMNTIRQTLEQTMVDNFSAPSDVRFPNVNFNESNKALWVDFNVVFSDSQNRSIGANTPTNIAVRRNGAVLTDIYVKPDTGSVAALTVVDEIISLFENQRYSGIQFFASSTRVLGNIKAAGDDPVWFVYSVRTEFYKYE